MIYKYILAILNFISSISWPIVCLIIVSFFKKPISVFLKRVKKITYGEATFESSGKRQKEEKSEVNLLTNGEDFDHIDQTLSKFSESTQKLARQVAETETRINEVADFQQKYERMLKYSQLLLIIKTSEKMYQLIYGSQIRILQKLNYSSEKSESLKYLYDNAVKYFPEVYKDYPYHDYLDFLVNQGLIIYDRPEDLLSITEVGRDFLRYLVESNSNLDKLY